MQFEFRWLRSAETTTQPDVLQYRTRRDPRQITLDMWLHGEWSDWTDVPIVIAPPKSGISTESEATK